MIFVYSTTATADVLPVGLLMIAIALIWYSDNAGILAQSLSALVFGLSIISKYNSIYFGLVFVAVIGLKSTGLNDCFRFFIFGRMNVLAL